jgi:hypothetical protein
LHFDKVQSVKLGVERNAIHHDPQWPGRGTSRHPCPGCRSTEAEMEHVNQLRDKSPAEPIRFE